MKKSCAVIVLVLLVLGVDCKYPRARQNGCMTDNDCPMGTTCAGGQCVQQRASARQNGCMTDNDCPMGTTCAWGQCITQSASARQNGCVTDNDCPIGATCAGGQCITQRASARQNGCVTDNDCPMGTTCAWGQCITQSASARQDGCVTDNDCPIGTTCAGGMCMQPRFRALEVCMTEYDCPTGNICSGGQCIQQGASALCTGDQCPFTRSIFPEGFCIEDEDCPVDKVCVGTQCISHVVRQGGCTGDQCTPMRAANKRSSTYEKRGYTMKDRKQCDQGSDCPCGKVCAGAFCITENRRKGVAFNLISSWWPFFFVGADLEFYENQRIPEKAEGNPNQVDKNKPDILPAEIAAEDDRLPQATRPKFRWGY